MSLAINGVAANRLVGDTLAGSQQFSIFAWVFQTNNGGQQHLWSHGASGTPRIAWRLVNGIPNLQCVYTGLTGVWTSAAGAIPLNAWTSVAVVHDGSASLNNPAMYVNGTAVPVTRSTGPSGVMSSDAQLVTVGNALDVNRALSGNIGEVAEWNRLVNPDEIAALHHLGVYAVPDHVFYTPCDNGTSLVQECHGLTMTLTGAGAAENPPTRPAGRRG